MSSYGPAYEYKNNKHYKEFVRQKEEIKQRYPSEIFQVNNRTGKKLNKELTQEYFDKGYRKLHQEYLKELADLIFEPNGSYQKMSWDIMTESQQLEQERLARGKKRPKLEY